MNKKLYVMILFSLSLASPLALFANEPSTAMQVQMLIHHDQRCLRKAQAAVNSGDLGTAKKYFMRIAQESMVLQKKIPPRGGQSVWDKALMALAKDAIEGAHFAKQKDSARVRASITTLTDALSGFQREFK
jgi:hypothetical protein